MEHGDTKCCPRYNFPKGEFTIESNLHIYLEVSAQEASFYCSTTQKDQPASKEFMDCMKCLFFLRQAQIKKENILQSKEHFCASKSQILPMDSPYSVFMLSQYISGSNAQLTATMATSDLKQNYLCALLLNWYCCVSTRTIEYEFRFNKTAVTN